MGPFEKALQKVRQRQMTHEDRGPGDRRVRDALKTMGDLAYDTTSLPFQMLTYSPEAEAAFNPKSVLKTLFHGGRPFTKWDPGTIGFGEGRFLAQGPGLYAGDIEDLARIYKKYGGDDPALLKLAVDDSRIFNPTLKMSPEHKEAYDRAASILDPRGYGLRGKLMDIPRYKYDQTRKLLVDSGIDGMRQRLGDELGDEWVIFNPDIIKSVDRIE